MFVCVFTFIYLFGSNLIVTSLWEINIYVKKFSYPNTSKYLRHGINFSNKRYGSRSSADSSAKRIHVVVLYIPLPHTRAIAE